MGRVWGGGGGTTPSFQSSNGTDEREGGKRKARLSTELSELKHDEAQDVEAKRYYDYQLICLAVCSL